MIHTYNIEKYGDLLRAMNRGGLKIPRHTVCQWAMFCVAFFTTLESPACKTAPVRYLSDILSFHRLSIPSSHCFTMANILLRCSILNTPFSSREPSQKLLKLRERWYALWLWSFYVDVEIKFIRSSRWNRVIVLRTIGLHIFCAPARCHGLLV